MSQQHLLLPCEVEDACETHAKLYNLVTQLKLNSWKRRRKRAFYTQELRLKYVKKNNKAGGKYWQLP